MEREEEDIAACAGRDISIQEQTSHGRDSRGRILKTASSIHTSMMMLFLFYSLLYIYFQKKIVKAAETLQIKFATISHPFSILSRASIDFELLHYGNVVMRRDLFLIKLIYNLRYRLPGRLKFDSTSTTEKSLRIEMTGFFFLLFFLIIFCVCPPVINSVEICSNSKQLYKSFSFRS